MAALLGVALALPQTGVAQRRPENAPRPGARMGGHAGEWLKKNKDLPLEQQQKNLQNDPNFKALPPQRQQQLMDRLQRFNSLPPQQKDRVIQRMETFDRLTPEQQQQARGVFNQFRTLPDERKGMVRRAYRDLQMMPPSQRQQILESDKFKSTFSDDERNLLKRSLDLNLGRAEPASPAAPR